MQVIFALSMLFKRPVRVVRGKFCKPEFRPSGGEGASRAHTTASDWAPGLPCIFHRWPSVMGMGKLAPFLWRPPLFLPRRITSDYIVTFHWSVTPKALDLQTTESRPRCSRAACYNLERTLDGPFLLPVRLHRAKVPSSSGWTTVFWPL
ncbi:hypothetical protein HJG60_009962 [Phyllostomus discolor]|uniref:Uncharacterized protein n=1 Tax=Phyllostomus discolor TaxID=89673 RepID=A0A834ELK9_9CHIR|nr:hypothetical protein HJG60_009962 [Phyllostomus discolor]